MVVVEDHDDLRDSLVELLQDKGHQVVGLSSAEEVDDAVLGCDIVHVCACRHDTATLLDEGRDAGCAFRRRRRQRDDGAAVLASARATDEVDLAARSI